MNTEERKDFDSLFAEKYPAIDRAAKAGDHTAQSTKGDAYGGWLMAKEHAASLVKPVPRLNVKLWADPNIEDKEVFYVYQPGWKSPHFYTEKEALDWAVENGYLVTENG